MNNQEQIIIPNTNLDKIPNNPIPPEPLFYEITDANYNCTTVKLLKSLINSKNGELSFYGTLFYQSLLTGNKNPNIFNGLKKIIQNQAEILRHLNNAIILFGGNPKFVNSQGNFWSTRYINYQTNPSIFLQNNISSEKNLLQKYGGYFGGISHHAQRYMGL